MATGGNGIACNTNWMPNSERVFEFHNVALCCLLISALGKLKTRPAEACGGVSEENTRRVWLDVRCMVSRGGPSTSTQVRERGRPGELSSCWILSSTES